MTNDKLVGRCLLFHQWSRWSQPQEKDYIQKSLGLPDRKVTRYYQERTCLRCGCFEWRVASADD